jgi:hypothetical protein
VNQWPGVAYFLLRHFPGVYAQLMGADPETVQAVILRRFGVMLPGELRTIDDCEQMQACFVKLERLAVVEARR